MIYDSTRLFARNEESVKGFLKRVLETLSDWLSKRLPDCKDITPTIGESLDRKLGWWERFVMKLHLFTCDPCKRYLVHLGFIHRTLHHHGEPIADPDTVIGSDLRDESKERIKQLLAQSAVIADQ